MVVTVIALKYALLVSQWSYGHFLWFSFIWITRQIFAIWLNAVYRVIPTKWRSYRDQRLCDVTSPYLFAVIAASLIPPRLLSSVIHAPKTQSLRGFSAAGYVSAVLRVTTSCSKKGDTELPAGSLLVPTDFQNLFVDRFSSNFCSKVFIKDPTAPQMRC